MQSHATDIPANLAQTGARRLPPRAAMLLAFAGSSVTNYAFGLLTGWLLLPGDFGLLAFTQTVLLVGGLVLNSGFAWSLTAALVTAPPARRGAVVRGALLANAGLGLGLSALVGGLFALGPLRAGLESGPIALLVMLTLPLLAVVAIARATAQGLERFGVVATLQVLEIVSKAAFGLALVAAGQGAPGAVAGFGAGALIAALAGAGFLHRSHIPLWGSAERPPLKGTSAMFGALLGMALLLNLDIVALKLFGGGDRALVGQYQAGIVLANTPYYLATALTPILFTQVARLKTIAHSQAAVGEALRLVLVFLVPIEIALMIAPAAVLGLLFPAAYLPGAAALRLLAAANCAVIMVAILALPFQATGRPGVPARVLLLITLGEALALRTVVPGWHAAGAATLFLLAALTAVLALGFAYARAVGAAAVRAALPWLLRYLVALALGVAVGVTALRLSGSLPLAGALAAPIYGAAVLCLAVMRVPEHVHARLVRRAVPKDGT